MQKYILVAGALVPAGGCGGRQAPAGVCAEVREGTVNEPERDVLARILDGEPDAVLFSCYLWNIRKRCVLPPL